VNVVWFNGWEAIARTLLAGSATYFALIALLRWSGPRTLAKWYAFDLIITVALGSTFANGVLSSDISIAQALAAFVLLIALQFIVVWLVVHFPWLLRAVNPPPVLLLLHGQLQAEPMRCNRITRADVCKALRSHGVAAIEDAAVVILEPDGTFSVIASMKPGHTSALDDVPAFHDMQQRRDARANAVGGAEPQAPRAADDGPSSRCESAPSSAEPRA
jgi:uncharacterized membrane protein YcaP (DUF421 family)